MIEHTTAPTSRPIPPIHSVKCCKGRHEQLISNVTAYGFTVWCRSDKMVEPVTWDRLPSDLLQSIVDEIARVLVARGSNGV